MPGVARIFLLCAVAFGVVRVEGQGQVHPPFTWGFNANVNVSGLWLSRYKSLTLLVIKTELTQCQTYPITLSPNSGSTAVGVAPYYLIAFEPNGIPTTTMVGSDPNNLMWTANHKQGSLCMGS